MGGSKLSATRNSGICKPDPIRIGLVTDEPIRLAGLTSIFDQRASMTLAQFLLVVGSLPELLSDQSLKYLVVDLLSYGAGLNSLDAIRRARPDIRLIVIGPSLDDESVLRSIIAGARAYLGSHESPEMVRQAIEVVTEGSIWAPRKLLSKLIDRLLKHPESSFASATPQMTSRELQVLELIMKANSNREIACQLGIQERTVRAHLARLMRKAGVDNRIKLSISAPLLLQLAHRAAGLNAAPKQSRRPITS
jgi:DNA-binding NarL/FixJ family response regulator